MILGIFWGVGGVGNWTILIMNFDISALNYMEKFQIESAIEDIQHIYTNFDKYNP